MLSRLQKSILINHHTKLPYKNPKYLGNTINIEERQNNIHAKVQVFVTALEFLHGFCEKANRFP